MIFSRVRLFNARAGIAATMSADEMQACRIVGDGYWSEATGETGSGHSVSASKPDAPRSYTMLLRRMRRRLLTS